MSKQVEPRTVVAAAGEGRHRVHAIAVDTGMGVIVSLAGGDRPHVGAIGVGVPRPSLRESTRMSASSSVLTLTGHRDDELAKPLADLAAARLGQIAVVVVGVHVDDAAGEDIALLSENTRRAAALVLERILARGVKET